MLTATPYYIANRSLVIYPRQLAVECANMIQTYLSTTGQNSLTVDFDAEQIALCNIENAFRNPDVWFQIQAGLPDRACLPLLPPAPLIFKMVKVPLSQHDLNSFIDPFPMLYIVDEVFQYLAVTPFMSHCGPSRL